MLKARDDFWFDRSNAVTHFRRAFQADFKNTSPRQHSREAYAHPERIVGSFANERRPTDCPVPSALDRAVLDLVPFWLRQHQSGRHVAFGVGRRWSALGNTFAAAASSLQRLFPGSPVADGGRVSESRVTDEAALAYYHWKVRRKLSPSAITKADKDFNLREALGGLVAWNDWLGQSLDFKCPKLLLDHFHRLERHLDLPLFELTAAKQINPNQLTLYGNIALSNARRVMSGMDIPSRTYHGFGYALKRVFNMHQFANGEPPSNLDGRFLRDFEQHLGFRIFSREHRRINTASVTPPGRELLKLAQVVVDAENAMKAAMKSYTAINAPQISIHPHFMD
ncbi:MAG: hypothetical protein JNN07_21540 [Verrucomicrobiales bacterium]|nr:hypothetical protein [Verrucomicrobiales bacterium]